MGIQEQLGQLVWKDELRRAVVVVCVCVATATILESPMDIQDGGDVAFHVSSACFSSLLLCDFSFAC